MKKVLIPTKLDATCKNTLEGHGAYTVFQDESADLLELAKTHADAYAMVVRSNKVTAEVIDAFPELKVVIRAGAGFNTIDTAHARSKGIDVMNTPGANSNAVAEEVVALMLAHARHIVAGDASCRSGKWEKASFMGREITGKTLGILGLGHIGRLLAKRVSGFDMQIIGFDPMISKDRAAEIGVRLVTVEELFEQADYISLHIPENDATRSMVNAKLFDKMKPGAVIINCARAGVLNEDDLRTARKTKDIYLLNDVYPKDEAGDKLIADIADIMLPHLGASTKEANFNAAQFAAKQLIDYDEKGITHAIVNRDIPAGLDRAYADLAHTLTKVCRAIVGEGSQLKLLETSVYGNLAEFGDWLVVPMTAALNAGFHPTMDRKAAVDFLTGLGIDYTNREAEEKGYGNSVTVDLTAHADGDKLVKASVRGTVTEGNITLARINDFDKLYIEPSGCLTGFIYDDRPGVLGKICSMIADADINIDDVRNPHDAFEGNTSIALLKINKEVPQSVLDAISEEIDAHTAFYVCCC